MTATAQPHPSSAITDMTTVPGYWGFGSLWSPLVTSGQTAGHYSIVEQLMPGSSGPPPHTHDRNDEVFYILEGEVHLQLGDSTAVAHAGQLVRVPRGTPHGFVVTSDQARFLNLFVPAAMDEMVAALSVPATATTVPPPGSERQPSPEQIAEFAAHLQQMASLSWSPQPDLLSSLRHGEQP